MNAIRVIPCMACGASSFQNVIACEYCKVQIHFVTIEEACRALVNSGEPLDTPAFISEIDDIYFEKGVNNDR